MRILHIMGSADYGGVPSVVYNYMKYIDRNKHHFEFALNSDPGTIGKQMQELGAKFYRLPFRSDGIFKYRKALTELLAKEHFDVIHVHSGSVSYLDLQIAKKQGIKCRVVHAHTAAHSRTLKEHIRVWAGRVLNYYYATKMIACGELAGNEIFGKACMKSSKTII